MVYVPIVILLVHLIWGCAAVPVLPEQPASESFSQSVDPAQLARDTVQFCYSPNGHPHEVCKTYIFAAPFQDTWQKARDYCISLGLVFGVPMDSVAIESREENELIKNHIETNYPTLNWWTSGSSNNRAEVFIWSSTGYTFTYNDWRADGPFTGKLGVVFYHNSGEPLKWTIDYLSNSYYALCEQNN